MKTTFSVDLHDRDGDVVDKCILIHVSDQCILQFSDMRELESFAADLLHRTIPEIKQTYPSRFDVDSEEYHSDKAED